MQWILYLTVQSVGAWALTPPSFCIYKRQIIRFIFMVLNVCWFSYLMRSNLNEFHIGERSLFASCLFSRLFSFIWRNIAAVSVFWCADLSSFTSYRAGQSKSIAWGANETCYEYIWIVKCLWCAGCSWFLWILIRTYNANAISMEAYQTFSRLHFSKHL